MGRLRTALEETLQVKWTVSLACADRQPVWVWRHCTLYFLSVACAKEDPFVTGVLSSLFEAPMISRILILQYKPDGCLFVSRVQKQIGGHLEVGQP